MLKSQYQLLSLNYLGVDLMSEECYDQKGINHYVLACNKLLFIFCTNWIYRVYNLGV